VLGALLLGAVLTVGLTAAIADAMSGTGDPGESHHVVTRQFGPGPDDFHLNAIPDPLGANYDQDDDDGDGDGQSG